MLKTLLKKQLLELNQGFFYNSRKGVNRTKKQAIIYILFYAFILFGFLGATFGMVAHSISYPLTSSGYGWLYFIVMYTVALVLGVFGSVFSTYTSLYISKDNDLLLSMPIPLTNILISRLAGVYFMGLVYSMVVILPSMLMYYLAAELNVWKVIGPIVLGLDITLFVFILSVLLGWVVAKVSLKMKNKSMATTALALVFFALYYVLYFKLINNVEAFLAVIANHQIEVKGAMKVIYFIGSAGDGNPIAMLIVTAVMLVVLFAVYLIIDKTFIKIVTTKTGVSKVKYREKKAIKRSVGKALLFKETKHFTSSTGYMLNCGLGSVFMLAGAISLIVKGSTIRQALEGVFGEVSSLVVVMAMGIMVMIMTMNDITAPSISLEGNTLWITKSLPVTSLQVIRSKMWNHVMITLPPALLLALAAAIALKFSLFEAVILLLFTALTCFNQANYGLMINLKKPNFNWTNEMVVLKQGWGIFITMFSGWIIGALVIVSAFFLVPTIGGVAVIGIWLALSVLTTILLDLWIRKRGVKLFDEL